LFVRRSIVIVRGPGGAASRVAEEELAFRWDFDPTTAAPWAGLRRMLSELEAALGADRVNRAIAPRAAQLALVLRRIDVAADDSLAGLMQMTKPDTAMRHGPVIRALADTIAELLEGRPSSITINEASRVDLGSLMSIRPLMRAAGERLAIVIGRDPAVAPDTPLGRLERALALRQVTLLEALPGARVSEAGDGAPLQTPEVAPHRLDDNLEARALGPGADDRLRFEGMRAAFDGLGFAQALRLALSLDLSAFDDSRRRLAHRVAALACHNLAPLARDEWALRLMAEHYAAALEGESAPLERAHLLYRLTMLHGRGFGDSAKALAFADRAVAEAAAADAPAAPFFEGWAHNGRAYARLRAGRVPDAALDCEAGLDSVSRAGGVESSRLRLLRLLLTNNRARIAEATGDGEALTLWRGRIEEAARAMPADERPGHLWFAPPEDTRDLAVAGHYYGELLDGARARLDPEAEAVAAHGLGAVRYRLGDALGARECFATSLRIWRVTTGFPEDIATEELNCAVTAYRAGFFEEAESGFARLRENPLFDDEAAQSELIAAQAMTAARRGDAEAALTRSTEAETRATSSGDSAALLRVLRSAADAALALGHAESARGLLHRALSLAGDETPAEDLFGVLSALHGAGDEDRALTARALELVPLALGDVNAWWDLERLVPHARPLAADLPGAAEFWQAVQQRQRKDAS
jgi:hypothetical protein